MDGRRRVLGTVCGLAGVLVLALLVRHFRGTSAADAQSPAPVAGVRRAVVPQGAASNASARPGVSTRAAGTASPTSTRSGAAVRASSTQSGARPAVPGTTGVSKPQVVAVVNGEPISRTDLGREAVRQYGREVLEAMVNKRLIAQECQRRGVTVTQAEVDAEIKRLARRFNLPLDQWLKLLEDERGITPEEYAEDIIWSTLALRKLAGERLKVSQSELAQEFERRYGPAVDVRLIACGTLEKARQVLASIRKMPAPAWRGASSRFASIADSSRSNRPPSVSSPARFPRSSKPVASTSSCAANASCPARKQCVFRKWLRNWRK